MSYVTIGAIPVATTGLLARTGGKLTISPLVSQSQVQRFSSTAQKLSNRVSWYQLVPQLDIVNVIANNSDSARKFYTDVIQMWIDQDRGIPGIGDFEQGYKAKSWDGKYGRLGTTFKGRFWDFSGIYKKAGADKDPMRAAAIILCFQRDPVHFAKVMGLVAGKNLLRAVGLGEVPVVADPAAAAAAAAAAAGPAPDASQVPAGNPKQLSTSDLSGLFGMLQGVMDFLSGMWPKVEPAVTSMFDQNTVPTVLIEEPQKQEEGSGDIEPSSPLTLPIAMGVGLLAAYFLLKKK